ncbi:MAG: hypothetical protein H6840_04370 [Planctomycetes bacterium]|nr:hypothetical protein [Planctomycetota bacterium]
MVPEYDDDDIVEDYEEVSSDSARRVSSAQGGPVKRPVGGARPSTTAMPALPPDQEQPGKGKISHKSAKQIWIICIAITVLGLAAVLADVVFDAFGRRAGSNTTPVNVNNPGSNRTNLPPRNQEQLTPHQKNAAAFGLEVHKHRNEAIGSRGYDFLRLAMKKMNESFDAANKDRANEQGWVGAWVAYYEAEYALELFYKANQLDPLDDSFTRISDYRDREECELLEDDELLDAAKQRKQGVYQAASDEATKINKHKKLLVGFAVSANVPDKDEFKGPIDEAKARLKAAREHKEFLPADLEYVNRPPRGPDEQPPYVD